MNNADILRKCDELLRMIREDATSADMKNRKSWVYGILHAIEIFTYNTDADEQ